MRRIEKAKALRLRARGSSYDEIKRALGISKSTLHYWLKDQSLTPEQKKTLRGRSKRIENFRETFRKKREERLRVASEKARKLLGRLSERDLFIAGISLYWAEGYKTADTTTALANTDPAMIRFFIRWITLLGVSEKNLRIRLQLYADMDEKKEIDFWAQELKLSKSVFKTPYRKKTNLSDITYRGGFGHGTCNVLYHNRPVNDLVLALIGEVRKTHT